MKNIIKKVLTENKMERWADYISDILIKDYTSGNSTVGFNFHDEGDIWGFDCVFLEDWYNGNNSFDDFQWDITDLGKFSPFFIENKIKGRKEIELIIDTYIKKLYELHCGHDEESLDIIPESFEYKKYRFADYVINQMLEETEIVDDDEVHNRILTPFLNTYISKGLLNFKLAYFPHHRNFYIYLRDYFSIPPRSDMAEYIWDNYREIILLEYFTDGRG
jgi:hypothetical protein